ELPVLVVIACALGLGQAIETSGLADALAKIVINLAAALGPLGVIAAVYIATSLLTELITNNAAAALMMAIAMSAARDLGAEPKAFAIAVAIAASASFMTPIGYQTNLMVMSAGGYRFSDYLRSGLIVNVLVGTVAIGMIGWIWL
ncbi:MAG: anion permease, partial [Calditrichaeota bacterium]|nr:anion permease [Calditrichota bacterium]